MKKLSETIKRLLVFNPKGGVGKTAIALNFALTCGYGVVTNDRNSIVESVLDHTRCLTFSNNPGDDMFFPNFNPDWPIIYDFGGFVDSRIEKVIKVSEYVLVPVLPFKENIQTNLNFIEELKEYKSEDRIILIINQLVGGGIGKPSPAFKKLAPFFKKYNPGIKIFPLRASTAFSWMIDEKKSLIDIAFKVVSEKKVFAKSFEAAAFEFWAIIKYLRSRGE